MLHVNRWLGAGVLISLALTGWGCAPSSNTFASGTPSTVQADSKQVTLSLKRFEREGMVAKQKTGVWCWAACAEMVNNYYGRKVPQETIVERIQGRAAADPEAAQMAKRQEVLAALDTDLYERLKEKDAKEKAWLRDKLMHPLNGLHLTLSTAREFPREPDLKFNPDQLINDLKNQNPVVLGLGVRTPDDSGHIVVIYAAEAIEIKRTIVDDYADSAANTARGFIPFFKPKVQPKQATVKYKIIKVHCADPDGGKTTDVSAAELDRRADFLATQEGAREYIEYLDKVAHYVTLRAQ